MTKRTPPYSPGSAPVRCGWFWDRQGEHASQWADLMTTLEAERAQMIASWCWSVDQTSKVRQLTRAAVS
jgi:hypothetical protein